MENKLLTQEDFLSLFSDTRFRYINDVTGSTIQGNNVLDLSWNEKGYGIFFTVNGFPLTGKADQSQLVSLNANYVDFDVDASLSQDEKSELIQEAIMSGMEAGTPPPTVINRTQKGAHLIWVFSEKLEPSLENIGRWKDVQRRLVALFKGDRAAVDPSRVLRVPYTKHLKDPQNPFEITVMSYKPNAVCTLDELDATVPKSSNNEVSSDKVSATELLLKGVPVGEGQRHSALMQIAGLFLKGADTQEKVAIARMNYYSWDQRIVGSPEKFSDRKKELDNVFDGVLKREVSSRKENGVVAVKEVHTNTPKLWTVGEILVQDFGEEEWLVNSLISKQGITALSGNPGDYKTWVTIHIALCVSRNTAVFGKYQATQGGVLIIDEEDHLRLLKKRLELLGAKETDNIHYFSQGGIMVDIEEVRDMIVDIVKEKNIKLVILDSLVRVHQQEENDSGGMAKVFKSLQKILAEGASILFTHHHRKQQAGGASNPAQSMRGSSDILAAVDCHITIEKRKDEENRLVIRQTKLRQAELLPPFELSITKGDLGPSGFEYIGDYNERRNKAEKVSEEIVVLLEQGMKNRGELHEVLIEEFGKTAIDEGIKIALDTGSIVKVPKEEIPKEDRKKAFYRLPAGVGIIDQNDLPASLLHIDAEKQEDDEW